MSLYAFVRNCVYLVQDVKDLLWPGQLVAAMREHDFAVAAQYDAAEAAREALNEYEAEHDGLEGKLVGSCTETNTAFGHTYFCELPHGHEGRHRDGGCEWWYGLEPAGQCLGCGDCASDSHVCQRSAPADCPTAGSSGEVGSPASAPTSPPSISTALEGSVPRALHYLYGIQTSAAPTAAPAGAEPPSAPAGTPTSSEAVEAALTPASDDSQVIAVAERIVDLLVTERQKATEAKDAIPFNWHSGRASAFRAALELLNDPKK